MALAKNTCINVFEVFPAGYETCIARVTTNVTRNCNGRVHQTGGYRCTIRI
jgi:hypothetical protein